jgi:Zn finger protein HypA/HybF involved in hydrogenase expression
MMREELLEKYKYVRDENRHVADLKKQIKDAEVNYTTLKGKELDVIERHSGRTLAKYALPMLLATISGILTIVLLFNHDIRKLSVFMIGATFFFYGIAGLIMRISFAKQDRDQNAIESARIHNEEVIPAYHVYQEKIDQFNRALSVSKLAVYENTIPEVYRNEDAINFFITALETLRADSEKELFNLYEEDLHRRKIEQLEQEKLQQLDASLVHCPKCNGTHCRMITSTKTDSTPFGLGDACCGWILFGPIGILCGLCGASSSTETKTYWVCDDCGKKFSDD